MGQRIIVFGSFVVDLMGRAEHLPIEGETVKGNFFKVGPGGKGSNQAVAARRLGADVELVTKLGQDTFAQVALESFRSEGFNLEYILTDKEEGTGAALILVSERTARNSILVYLGACGHITEEDMRPLQPLIASSGLLLCQLETNLDATVRAIRWAHEAGSTVVLNPAPVQRLPEELYPMVDVLTPNEVEAAELTGIPIEGADDARRAAAVLLKRGVKGVIVTLGANGALVAAGETYEHIPPYTVECIDTTGAGDAFNGGLVYALAEGMELVEAARYANAVGALSTTKLGTAPAMPYREEVERFLKGMAQ